MAGPTMTTNPRPPVSREPSTEKCDAVLAYCALPMRHAGTHEYPHAAMTSHLAEARATPTRTFAEAVRSGWHAPGMCEARATPPSLDEPTLTRILSDIAPVVGGDLLEGGVPYRVGLASAILDRISEQNDDR